MSRNLPGHLLALLALALFAHGARGQESETLTRADGASVPVRVYGAGGATCRALEGGWSTRTVPYDGMPAGCKWLGVIDGARHMDFGGRGHSREVESLTIRAAEAFLDSAAAGRCGRLPEADGIAYRHK